MGMYSFRDFSEHFQVGDFVASDNGVIGVMAIVDATRAIEAPDALQVMTPQGELRALTDVCRASSADSVAVTPSSPNTIGEVRELIQGVLAGSGRDVSHIFGDPDLLEVAEMQYVKMTCPQHPGVPEICPYD